MFRIPFPTLSLSFSNHISISGEIPFLSAACLRGFLFLRFRIGRNFGFSRVWCWCNQSDLHSTRTALMERHHPCLLQARPLPRCKSSITCDSCSPWCPKIRMTKIQMCHTTLFSCF